MVVFVSPPIHRGLRLLDRGERPGLVDKVGLQGLVPAAGQLPAHLLRPGGTRAAAGGFYAGHPPFDVSHAELVSTVRDYTRFARMLADGGRFKGRQIVSEHLRL